ncbi:DUF4199 domain-containing protein [Compostibacter hankyongensis]|uniref:DUF4199 domain-containing protein n=1 Tax=Compostibacter hankyongensis TaxID=1007089 RepID=A0ABP8FPP7_9BACT
MENTTATKMHISYAITISIILILVQVIGYVFGISQENWFGYINQVLLLIGVLMEVRSYGKSEAYTASFGKLFGSGFKTTLIITLIMLVFLVVFILLFPDVKSRALEIAREKMEHKQLSEEQIDQGLAFTSRFFMVFAIIGSIFFNLVTGIIGSLIGAAVTKKDAHPEMTGETPGENPPSGI